MPYKYKSVSLTNINKDGTALSPVLTFTPATTPTSVERFAIGNRVRMSLIVEKFGGDNWTNKLIRVNLGMFLGSDYQGGDFGFTTNSFVTGVAQAGVIDAGSDGLQLTRENIDAISFQLTAPSEVTIIIDFYITTDVGDYVNTSYFVNNQIRFLIVRRDFFNLILRNFIRYGTVFDDIKKLGITTRVYNYVGFLENVLHPTTSAPFWTIPMTNRWYNSEYYADTVGQRYISDIQITSPSQIAAGVANLTDISATASQVGSAAADSIFTIVTNQLSPNEKNSVSITLNGFSDSSLTITTIDDIRVLLIRTDNFSNINRFIDTYDTSEAIIPTLAAGSAQLDGAIWSPTAWVQNGGTGEITLDFVIDGAELDLAREYRIIVNIYETANPERPTSHISPAIYNQYIPPAIPTIDGYLATYQKEFATNDLTDVSPHNRVRARLEIDKTSYSAALTALGLTGTFDDSFSKISAELVGIPTVIASTTETYRPNTLPTPLDNSILTSGMELVTDDATTFSAAATFRIEEERVNTTATVRWTVTMNQPNFVSGSFTSFDIQYDQILGIRFFENDNGAPYLTAVRFLDPDTYPTTKTDIIDICDRDKVIVEVEKDNALLTGAVNFIATIYPATETGDTTNPEIAEEEDWTPASPPLPIQISGKLDAVETSFGGDDFATFEINCQQLTQGQRYFITGIAIEQTPDYCPIGLVQNVLISTIWNSTGLSGWLVTARPTNFINEILADPNYVGGLNVIDNKVVDSLGNLVGSNTYSGYNLNSALINTLLTDVFYIMRIDANFDTGSGVHTVSHTLNVQIARPVIDTGAVFYDTNAYNCNDLG
jgi:hypothetical protein